MNFNFIGGEFKKSFSGSFVSRSNFYDYSFYLPDSSLIELNLALSSSVKAKKSVQSLSFEERTNILNNAFERYSVDEDELNHLVKMTGMPKKYVYERVNFGKIILKIIPEMVSARYGHKFGTITKEVLKNYNKAVDFTGYESHIPIDGLISVFMPPNDPAEVPFILSHIAMYGGTAIIKPSASEPYFSLKIADLLTKAGYPKGALNVIQWDTKNSSRIGVHRDLIRSSTHRIIMGGKSTADMLLKFTDESGKIIEEHYSTGNNCIFSAGNSKAIVDEGCDVDEVAEMLIKGAYEWTRDCVSTKSVFVVGNDQKNVLIEALKKKLSIKCKKQFDPLDDDCELGFCEEANKAVEIINGLVTFNSANLHFGKLDSSENTDKTHAPFLLETTNLSSPLLHNEFPYTLTIVPINNLHEAVESANVASSFLENKMTMAVSVFSRYKSMDEMFRNEPEKVNSLLKLKCHMLMYNKPSVALNVFLRHQDTLLTEFLTKPLTINHD